MKNQNSVQNGLDMQKVLARIFKRGIEKNITMILSNEAEDLNDECRDSLVEFRKQVMYKENKVCVMSKSVGLIIRLSGVICLLRNAVNEINGEQMFDAIAIENDLYATKLDFEMGKNITEYSVNSSFALLSYKSCTK